MVDFLNKNILAPLTKGGNLPFRRLCAEFGADITVSEMAYSRFIVRGEGRERALLRRHLSERCFGAQLAAKAIDEARAAVEIAKTAGAEFVDINCGCPIYDTVRRGLGAHLLKKPAKLGRFIGELVKSVSIPITAKIRIGWDDNEITAPEVSRILEEAGVAAITIHGRTREQRYSRQANWDLIGEIVSQRSVPIIGNGDILTLYEAQERKSRSNCAALMIGRGALIKPWIFKELKDGCEWLPTTTERIEIYLRLTRYFKDHFREDEKGYQRTMFFLPWHFSMFHRYRHLPQAQWEARSREHPLIQTRAESCSEGDPLEVLLRDPRSETHQLLAQALWESTSLNDAITRLHDLALHLPAPQTSEQEEQQFQG